MVPLLSLRTRFLKLFSNSSFLLFISIILDGDIIIKLSIWLRVHVMQGITNLDELANAEVTAAAVYNLAGRVSYPLIEPYDF
jgi:hypothetical protein